MNFDDILTIPEKGYPHNQKACRRIAIAAMTSRFDPNQIWVEFGVSRGASARILLDYMPRTNKLYLLDSYEGLPEWWNGMAAGYFKIKKSEIPEFDDPRVIMINGLFKDTMPELLSKEKEFHFLHIDCDLYSSTCDVLFTIGDHLANPCYLLFDEFYNYPGYEKHEYKAFFEFLEIFKLKYAWLFKTPGCQVGVKVWK